MALLQRVDHGDVARYAQLRRLVLDGNAGGWRLGLGVLLHHGVTAWLRSWDDLPGPDPALALSMRRPGRLRVAASSWSQR